MRNRRAVQRKLNYEGDIFRDAWDSLANPVRIVENQGGVLSLETWGLSKEGQQAIEGGTDIPTTDTVNEPAA